MRVRWDGSILPSFHILSLHPAGVCACTTVVVKPRIPVSAVRPAFAMLSVTINGDIKHFDADPLIEEVLRQLDVPLGAVAVEVNRTLVPRSAHAVRRLSDGDEVEVVTFVGGG